MLKEMDQPAPMTDEPTHSGVPTPTAETHPASADSSAHASPDIDAADMAFNSTAPIADPEHPEHLEHHESSESAAPEEDLLSAINDELDVALPTIGDPPGPMDAHAAIAPIAAPVPDTLPQPVVAHDAPEDASGALDELMGAIEQDAATLIAQAEAPSDQQSADVATASLQATSGAAPAVVAPRPAMPAPAPTLPTTTAPATKPVVESSDDEFLAPEDFASEHDALSGESSESTGTTSQSIDELDAALADGSGTAVEGAIAAATHQAAAHATRASASSAAPHAPSAFSPSVTPAGGAPPAGRAEPGSAHAPSVGTPPGQAAAIAAVAGVGIKTSGPPSANPASAPAPSAEPAKLEAPVSAKGSRLAPLVDAVMLPLAPFAALGARLGDSVRQTIGYLAVMTLFFAIIVWGIAIFKKPGSLPEGEGTPFVKQDDPAHKGETSAAHGEPGAHGSPADKSGHGEAPTEHGGSAPAEKPSGASGGHGESKPASKDAKGEGGHGGGAGGSGAKKPDKAAEKKQASKAKENKKKTATGKAKGEAQASGEHH